MQNQEMNFLTSLYEDYPVAVFLVSSHNKILYANQKFSLQFKYSSKSDNDNLEDYLSKETLSALDIELKKMSKKKKKFIKIVSHKSKNQLIDLVFIGKKVKVDNKNLRLITCIELPSKDYTRDLQKCDPEFFSQLNHEIRTPLNAILGMSEILLDSSLTDEQLKCINQVIKSSQEISKKIKILVERYSGKSNEEEAEVECKDHQEVKQKGIKLSHLNVLIAEDNEVNQKVTYNMLKKLGCRIKMVKNGKEAIDAWEKEKFNLILMDIQMPVMDGVEATRYIREKEKKTGEHVIIIAYTALGMSEEKDTFLSEGMDEYILKPVTFVQFFCILNQLFNFTKSTT